MPGARLAKNCLLWHYIRFLCLFFFKGKEKLKSPLRIGRWMCLAWKSREEHLRRSKVSWEKDQWLLLDHKHGLLHTPCFLRRHARSALPHPPPPAPPPSIPQRASKPGQPPWSHTEPKVSCRELFWVRYILTCLPVGPVVGCPDCRGMGSETPCPRHTKRRSFPLRNDFSSPTALHRKIKAPNSQHWRK